jgi:DNA-binding response OmpR family regulator
VVDDTALVREQLAGFLKPHGFEVEHAENGAVALRLMEDKRFDVAFLDVEMPVLDGPSLLRVIRARGNSTIVVLITSTSDTRRLVSIIKLGAADYLRKPFDENDVSAVLGRLNLV